MNSTTSRRADARRNRARILAAAEEVFGERGSAASTEEVASRAGVAIGTVFRHFPTKRDLVGTITTGIRDRLTAQVWLLASHGDPADALFECFTGLIGAAAANRTVLDLLAESRPGPPAGLYDAVAAVLDRAQQAGTVRRDVRMPEVMGLLVAASAGTLRGGWTPEVRAHILAVIFAGLRADPV